MRSPLKKITVLASPVSTENWADRSETGKVKMTHSANLNNSTNTVRSTLSPINKGADKEEVTAHH